MLRCTIQELKKNFYPPYILVPVLGTLCLCLTAQGDTGGMGERIPVFSLILNNNVTETGEQITKSVLYLWKEGLGNWLQLFAPLLLTSGYIAQLSDERQSGQVQFQLLRSGNFRYCVSKILSGALTGGILLTAGYALYGILLSFFFPPFTGFDFDQQSYYLELYFENSVYLYTVRRLTGVFLYGMFVSVYGTGVAVLFRDKYMLVCLPFLLNYIYEQMLHKLIIDDLAQGAESVEWIEAFYPVSVSRLSFDRYQAVSVLLMLFLYAVITVLFYFSVKRGNYGA